MGKRRGRNSRRSRSQRELPEPEALSKAPHSFVLRRGEPSRHAAELTRDFRRLMEPYTASQLKERKNNSIKDFVSVAGYLHVSHMCIFSMTKMGLYLKIARLPRGPTLTFKVHNFCFMKDVISSLKKQYFLTKAFHSSPLVVMNSFSGEGMHLKLMANMFQNMFPTINVSNVKLKTIRRSVLLNYNPDTKLIDFRHYYIKMSPVGLTKGTKKIVQGKVPNLTNCKDMTEFFDKAGMMSESEQEDDPTSHVTLPQNLSSRGARADGQSAIRLYEIGPRLTLQLVKVEDGLMDGEVLFHEFIHKTEEEKELIRKLREAKAKLKEKRKKTQEDNIKKKAVQKEEHKLKSLEGIKKKKSTTETQRLMDLAVAESQRENGAIDDDDAEYYRQQVGEEPEHDLFSNQKIHRKRTAEDANSVPRKRVKFDDNKVFNKGDNTKSNDKFNKNTKFNKNSKFNKNRSDGSDKKRKGGRGNNPKYGWRAQNNEEGNNDHNSGKKPLGNRKGQNIKNNFKDKGGRKSGPNIRKRVFKSKR